MAIDDETRARAMEAVRRRMAGEASDEDMESAIKGMNRPAARRAAAKPTDTGDELSRLTKKHGDADEIAANIKRLQAEDKPLERVEPESYLPPLRGIRAASAAKAALSSPRTSSIMDSPVAARLAAARAEKQKSGLANAQARSDSQKPEISVMEGEGARSFTPKMPPKPLNKKPARDLDEMRFADEGNPNFFRKGGKVSSASSRGDGIASKGKTRGKMC
tara:strand:- start:109 stop:765 length:657 start_codon:yes stop_codon:yes gene_type:complete